ncbi:MAG: TSUP family transporter [Chloroflexaceae bacterium]
MSRTQAVARPGKLPAPRTIAPAHPRYVRYRRWVYPLLLLGIYLAWGSFMTVAQQWALLQTYWPMALTMLFGSFVAGSTAAGGATVAFPVFTKLFDVPTTDARTFGLLIQTFGMGMAAITILLRRAPLLPRVVLWTSLGGLVGMVAGTYLVSVPQPYPKVLFTFATTLFVVTLALSRRLMRTRSDAPPRLALPAWNGQLRLLFIAVGLVGGVVASVVGSGIDMLVFIVLTLAFDIDEKVSTFTSVPIMALTSAVGFFVHGLLLQDVGIVWNYWLVCLPVVIVGAPLGAVILGYLQRRQIIGFLLILVTIEFVTTIWFISFTPTMVMVSVGFAMLCAFGFWAMLTYRATR